VKSKSGVGTSGGKSGGKSIGGKMTRPPMATGKVSKGKG
jgi:hypothetical protein